MTFVQIEERGRTPVLTLDLRLDASVQGAQEHLRWGGFPYYRFLEELFWICLTGCRLMHFWDGVYAAPRPWSRRGTKKGEKSGRKNTSQQQQQPTYNRERKKGVTCRQRNVSRPSVVQTSQTFECLTWCYPRIYAAGRVWGRREYF